jgi:hypothetical protein
MKNIKKESVFLALSIIAFMVVLGYFVFKKLKDKGDNENYTDVALGGLKDMVKTVTGDKYKGLTDAQKKAIISCKQNCTQPKEYKKFKGMIGDIGLGDEGDVVKMFQKQLNSKYGTNIDEDGKYGCETYCFAKVLMGKQ